MKVYDCFTFYNEFELLELRLKSLYDVVDYFVLVEADKTLTNKPKPFYFEENKSRYTEFFPKIRHIKMQLEVPNWKGTGDWSIEYAQRNAIAEGLKDAAPDDLVFISDLDEFWSLEIFQKLNDNQVDISILYPPIPEVPNVDDSRIMIPCKPLAHPLMILEYSPLAMEQAWHSYYMNLKAGVTWQGSILTRFKRLTTPQELRNLRTFLPRVKFNEGTIGWHLSYMGGVERIIDKMTSIVDGNEFVEKSGGKLIEKNHVEEAMENGANLYNRFSAPEYRFVHCDVSEIKLPYLPEFLRKYPHFLKPKD